MLMFFMVLGCSLLEGGSGERWPEHASNAISVLKENQAEMALAGSLRDGESVADRLWRGPFGPVDDTLVVLTQGSTGFGGYALVKGEERIDFPPFPDNGYAVAIVDAVFVDVDDDSFSEMVVLATWMKGVGDSAEHNNVVFDWDGNGFQRLPAVEEQVAQLASASRVKQLFAD